MTRRMLSAISLLITATLSLASCSLGGKQGNGKSLPASTGQPYEVLLEGDTLDIVKEILTEDVDILPQPEPMCDIISVKWGKVSGSYLLMRTRVVVHIGNGGASADKGKSLSDKGKPFSIKMSHDENAAPQNIIRIHASSVQELRDSLLPRARMLQATIYEAEQKHLVAVTKQNPEKQQLVKRLFGIDMKIPASMDASKEGKNFLWLSNNATRGMQNLIFIKVKSEERRVKNPTALDPTRVLTPKEIIDSMLLKNMVGETDEMYMQLSYPKMLFDGITQGLWEMKGDAMGGPYRMKRIPMDDDTLYIIAFVYAPEMKKRNLVKQLEAVTSTAQRAADK